MNRHSEESPTEARRLARINREHASEESLKIATQFEAYADAYDAYLVENVAGAVFSDDKLRAHLHALRSTGMAHRPPFVPITRGHANTDWLTHLLARCEQGRAA